MYRLCPHCSEPTFWVGEVLGDPAAECLTCGYKPNQTEDAEFECMKCHEMSTDVYAIVSGDLVCGDCIEEHYAWCDGCLDYWGKNDVKDGKCLGCRLEAEQNAKVVQLSEWRVG